MYPFYFNEFQLGFLIYVFEYFCIYTVAELKHWPYKKVDEQIGSDNFIIYKNIY